MCIQSENCVEWAFADWRPNAWASSSSRSIRPPSHQSQHIIKDCGAKVNHIGIG